MQAYYDRLIDRYGAIKPLSGLFTRLQAKLAKDATTSNGAYDCLHCGHIIQLVSDEGYIKTFSLTHATLPSIIQHIIDLKIIIFL